MSTQHKPRREYSDSSAAHSATQRALKARKGPATEGDRPPPSNLQGRKAAALDGQLSLDAERLAKEGERAA